MSIPEPTLTVDAAALRGEVRKKYGEVALQPNAAYHFHTGRKLAARLGYDPALVDPLPEVAVESFAGVADPFSLRRLTTGERAVDLGSGAGFDSFVAATLIGPDGQVVGVDMTAEMLASHAPPLESSGFPRSSFAKACSRRRRSTTASPTW